MFLIRIGGCTWVDLHKVESIFINSNFFNLHMAGSDDTYSVEEGFRDGVTNAINLLNNGPTTIGV